MSAGGYEIVFSALTVSSVISNGGFEIVSAGGTASMAAISAGGGKKIGL